MRMISTDGILDWRVVGFDIENFTIGARYNYGLTEIGKSNNLTGASLGNAKNNGLSIYVGFGF